MREIRALTGIRGIAALIVFFEHTRETLQMRGLDLPVSDLAKRLVLTAGRQVDIFFVLSGFILALTYKSWFERSVTGGNYLLFLRRRLARIWPLHAFMLVLTVALVVAAQVLHAHIMNGLDRFRFNTLPLDVLLVHAWPFFSGSPTEEMTWNPPSWSISIEALAYLVFPLFLWSTFNIRKRHPWMLVLAAIVVGFACNALVPWDRTSFTGAARGLSEFALGCVAANVFGSKAADWLRTNFGAAVALLVLLIAFALPTPACFGEPETWFGIGLVTAPLLLALSGRNFLGWLFGTPPLYFLGEISYSIYLGHFLFGSVAYRMVSVDWMKTGMLPTAFGLLFVVALVVGLSAVTYYAIERPGRNLLGGKRKNSATATLLKVDGN
jgi:peptidoglycan/LPS O-acetylase OafA/YrhL